MTAEGLDPVKFIELEYLLDLATRRTAGRIQAKAASLQVGSAWIDGFPQAFDAHYLAQAANVVPKLADQIISSRAVAGRQAQEAEGLRAEVKALQSQLAAANRERENARAALRETRQLVRTLKRKAKAKKRAKVDQVVCEVIRYRVIHVPATWLAQDGRLYELVYIPDQVVLTNPVQAPQDFCP